MEPQVSNFAEVTSLLKETGNSAPLGHLLITPVIYIIIHTLIIILTLCTFSIWIPLIVYMTICLIGFLISGRLKKHNELFVFYCAVFPFNAIHYVWRTNYGKDQPLARLQKDPRLQYIKGMIFFLDTFSARCFFPLCGFKIENMEESLVLNERHLHGSLIAVIRSVEIIETSLKETPIGQMSETDEAFARFKSNLQPHLTIMGRFQFPSS